LVAPEQDWHVGYLISDVGRMMRTVFDRRVRRIGLTRAQWLVLTRLNRHPGASQSELAEMLEVEKATAGRMIDRLERNGWVERRADMGDRRVNRLYLTAEAERIQAALRRISQQTVDDALAALAPQERIELNRLMASVKARLQQLTEAEPARTVEAAE
jgi:MarR family transcriptional regulator, transcriptional regulator for hemolysin